MTPDETKNPCIREIEVEVPADVVARETDAVIRKFQKLARLPGFRRGRVPAGIVRQRYGEDVKSEVVDALVPKYFRQEVEKQGLSPVSQPRVTDLHLREGEPLRFKASFEVLPPIEVSGYQELRAPQPDISVSEQEVDEALNSLREQHASYLAVDDRELRDGDFAQVSLRGIPKDAGGKPEAPGAPGVGATESKSVSVDEVLVEIGGANTVPEFNENLRGARPGEERSFDVVYDEKFSDQRLAGKTLDYSVTVKAIKQKALPGLNDDFAREVGEFHTLADLRQSMREQLEADKRHAAEHEAKEKFLDELVRRHDFPVPEALVERQVDLRLERGLRALAAQGMRAEDMKKMDFPRLRAGQRDAALREVKASLLLEKIADAENIQVSEEELAREIEGLAQQTKQPAEALRARLTRDGALDRIRNRIRNEKTLEFLYRRSA